MNLMGMEISMNPGTSKGNFPISNEKEPGYEN
jgi:hypothetical protein